MKEKICFLIDDDEDDREIFQLALDQIRGIKGVMSHNGKEALKMLDDNSFTPDFIFLDLNMPLLSGKECLQEIRKIPRLHSVPVFIYTTSSRDDDKVEIEKLGATGFITKPSKLINLVRILSTYLNA